LFCQKAGGFLFSWQLAACCCCLMYGSWKTLFWKATRAKLIPGKDTAFLTKLSANGIWKAELFGDLQPPVWL
jgi:hypothetical protein